MKTAFYLLFILAQILIFSCRGLNLSEYDCKNCREEPLQCKSVIDTCIAQNSRLEYQCHTLVVKFPKELSNISPWCSIDSLIKYNFDYIEDVLENDKSVNPDGVDFSDGYYERCLCDELLYFYHNPALQDWNIETAMARTNLEGPNINGGRAELNYIFTIEGHVPNTLVNWFNSSPTCFERPTLYGFLGNSGNPAISGLRTGLVSPEQPNVFDPNLDYELDIKINPWSRNCTDALEDINDNRTKLTTAILDTGIDLHFIDDKLIYNEPLYTDTCLNSDVFGWNFIYNNHDIFADHPHGTIVALSYIHALKEYSFELEKQRILPVKVMDQCGRGTLYSITCGVYYSIKKNVDVINMSLGAYLDSCNILTEAFAKAREDSIVIVCSAGNDYIDLNNFWSKNKRNHYPSSLTSLNSSTNEKFDHVFEIGASCINPLVLGCTHQDLRRWEDSNYRIDKMFYEPGIHYELLLKDYIHLPLKNSKGINGTSFSAPTFSGGVIRELHLLNKNEELSTSHMYKNSSSITIQNMSKSYSQKKAKCRKNC